jgi:hypothetical protein
MDARDNYDLMPRRCKICDARSCDCMGIKGLVPPTEAQIKQILGDLLKEKIAFDKSD